MLLKQILNGIKYTLIQGNTNKNVIDIHYDSRKVNKNSLFICINGEKLDGHKFALKAVKNGAEVLIVERQLESIPDYVTVIKVSSTQQIMSKIASNFYEEPSESMYTFGITGTNGKTTTATLISDILTYYNKKTGIIGTIENRIGKKILESNLTTPQAFDLQKLFYDMKKEKVEYVAMEVSSHSLDLHRVDDCKFDIGIFTNLTLDHLDYHKTMGNYLNAKIKLFKMCKYGLINVDDAASKKIINESTCKVYTYGIDNDADFIAKDIKMDAKGVKYILQYKDKKTNINLNIPGKFSVYNSLAAVSACYLAGIPLDVIKNGIEKVVGVRGRFQTIKADEGYSIIVDYAHAPDGLSNVLKTIKEFVNGKIICVFGCGGDRDRSKRPIMGEIAGSYSDYCIITSDNPRTENPEAILDEIEPGMKKTNCEYIKIADRKQAIIHALKRAEKEDVILIAGKGHEDYQIIGTQKIHFDDVEVVEEYLEEKGK